MFGGYVFPTFCPFPFEFESEHDHKQTFLRELKKRCHTTATQNHDFDSALAFATASSPAIIVVLCAGSGTLHVTVVAVAGDESGIGGRKVAAVVCTIGTSS